VPQQGPEQFAAPPDLLMQATAVSES
jgi:hypothetical protein